MHKLIWCGVLAAASLAAAPPIASVSSNAAFRLRGTEVQVAGVPQWPMKTGDEIATGKAPAMITFQGGSRVYLNAGSRARLEVTGKEPVLRLLNGDLAYKVAKQSPVSIAALGNGALPADTEEGSLSVMNNAAVWAPAAGERWASNGMFQQYKVSPFDMAFVSQWRGNEAPFGRPPGTPPGLDNPPNPPGPPPGRPPVSQSR